VVPEAAEGLLIGKPALDDLGFVSDRETIELRAIGVDFATILPPRSLGLEKGTCYVRSTEISNYRVADGFSSMEEVQLYLGAFDGRDLELSECREAWVEPGPDLPEGAQLVEGCVPLPLFGSPEKGSLRLQLVVHEPVFWSAGARLAVLRPVCKADLDLMTATRCFEEWHGEVQLLATSYKTRGKRQRQEELFPELQEEVAAARAKLSATVKYPDQTAEEYRQLCVETASSNLGSHLTLQQRERFLKEVVRPCSDILWMPGCSPPRVQGYTADLVLKPGAVPRITQPFPLSAYDQLRLEYHEDVEVLEGKAEWAPPGHASQWGSPSFVVDQEGKGLLGRPVRDYWYPNSQTLDSAWPSPSADRVLTRTQRVVLHTALDCIWGFTQLPISERAAEVFSLVTRRGILRPKVLYFGAKQGPAIFQALMDNTFGDLRDEDGEEFQPSSWTTSSSRRRLTMATRTTWWWTDISGIVYYSCSEP